LSLRRGANPTHRQVRDEWGTRLCGLAQTRPSRARTGHPRLGWATRRWVYPVGMEERMYYTYIVASRSHNFYVGVTSGIEVRVLQHKNGHFDGYSKKYNCNRLVWFERHPSILDAIAREKQLKGWSRAKKIVLIERDNPAWVDLSEEWGKPMKL